MSTPNASIPRPSPVSRLTFSYVGDKVQLVSEQQVTMIIPESHPLDKLEAEAGFSVILRDERGEPVYGRIIANPIRFDEEVFDRDPKRSIRREENPNPKGTFVLLVPALPNARRIEFFGHPLRPKAQLESSRRLATFTLAPLPRR